MPTIPDTTTSRLTGAGVAIVVGISLAAVLGWHSRNAEDSPAEAVDEAVVTEAAESLRWPEPPERSRNRSDRPLLELVGVIARNEGSIAIIREKDGAAQRYRVGDRVVDNRELIEIRETHVLLRNDGRTERLRISGRDPRQPPDGEELREFSESLASPPDFAGDPPSD